MSAYRAVIAKMPNSILTMENETDLIQIIRDSTYSGLRSNQATDEEILKVVRETIRVRLAEESQKAEAAEIPALGSPAPNGPPSNRSSSNSNNSNSNASQLSPIGWSPSLFNAAINGPDSPPTPEEINDVWEYSCERPNAIFSNIPTNDDDGQLQNLPVPSMYGNQGIQFFDGEAENALDMGVQQIGERSDEE